LVGLLAAVPVEVVLSSPSLRCVQTVEPLARARGLTVTNDDGLAEGNARKAVEVVRGLTHVDAVLCTHGDVVPEVLAALEDEGVRIEGPRKWQKGSVWTVHSRDGAFTHATYLPVPKV
jgi:8-oxo-dGTP diphosphatase